jgi:hypothetical protein
MGYNIRLSYGDSRGEHEGNIAWVWKQELELGAVTNYSEFPKERLEDLFGKEKSELILFIREMEKATRHKSLGIPSVDRRELLNKRYVEWNIQF